MKCPLRKLDLCAQNIRPNDLYHTDNVIPLLSKGWLTSLTHLSLSTLILSASTLQQWFSPARSGRLEHVSLRSTNLTQGTWHDVMTLLRASLPEQHALQTLDLYHLGQSGKRIEFLDNAFEWERFRWEFLGKGKEVEEALEGLEKNMKVTELGYAVKQPENMSLWPR
jgi:hypothetical protein